jgi:hypothetical protein
MMVEKMVIVVDGPCRFVTYIPGWSIEVIIMVGACPLSILLERKCQIGYFTRQFAPVCRTTSLMFRVSWSYYWIVIVQVCLFEW